VDDFNGDGKSDLAVANYNIHEVSILLGKGDGTFNDAVNYGVGYINSVAVGDFNGDGKADLVAASSQPENVSILLGNGDGTFGAAVNYSTGSYSNSVTVGDFNGDGKADMVIVNWGSSNILSVMLNTSLAVTTQDVTGIGTTTAIGNGNITALGSSNPTAYGVCWNTGGLPTISDNIVDNGATSTTGAFIASLDGLTPNITYHVRAFATNKAGTSYGNEVTFTTNVATGLENATNTVLSLYPNPASDGFTLNAGDNATTLCLYDLSGCLVLTQQATGKTYVDITSLPKGAYIIKANGLVGKLVKK
jgi:hypothetical protein